MQKRGANGSRTGEGTVPEARRRRLPVLGLPPGVQPRTRASEGKALERGLAEAVRTFEAQRAKERSR